MTQFELFCMIFYVLDAAYDQDKDEDLRNYLSNANPFLFEDIGSADPATYAEFCADVPNTISREKSYSIASQYIKKLQIPSLVKAFSTISETEWLEGLNSYLDSPHKK